jgi:hypothetical protein
MGGFTLWILPKLATKLGVWLGTYINPVVYSAPINDHGSIQIGNTNVMIE